MRLFKVVTPILYPHTAAQTLHGLSVIIGWFTSSTSFSESTSRSSIASRSDDCAYNTIYKPIEIAIPPRNTMYEMV